MEMRKKGERRVTRLSWLEGGVIEFTQGYQPLQPPTPKEPALHPLVSYPLKTLQNFIPLTLEIIYETRSGGKGWSWVPTIARLSFTRCSQFSGSSPLPEVRNN